MTTITALRANIQKAEQRLQSLSLKVEADKQKRLRQARADGPRGCLDALADPDLALTHEESKSLRKVIGLSLPPTRQPTRGPTRISRILEAADRITARMLVLATKAAILLLPVILMGLAAIRH